MHTLETRLISRRLASRREGLATEQYTCIRLYSESALLAMPISKDSDKTSQSAHVRVFDRLALGETDLTRAGWSPRLHPDDLARVAQDLVVWGLVDEHGTLTERGKCVSRITMKMGDHPLEPIWANAIYEASKLGCMDEVITISALCSIQKNVFQDVAGMERIASISRAKFAHGPSDHLALLNAFMQYQQLVDRDESHELCKVWCRLHFLNFGALQDASQLRTTIKTAASGLRPEDNTRTQSSTPETNESRTEASSGTMKSERGFCSEDDCYSAPEDHVNDDDDLGAHEQEPDEEMISAKMKADPGKHANILKAITRAFSTQIAISLGSGDKYCTVDTNVTAMLHASCALVDLQPQWVVYTQLSRRSRFQFLDIVSVVDVDWLLDLPNFQPDALTRDNGKIRQAAVKDALDAARVKATAAQLSRAL
ncbi:hypothetical protein LMH87_001249 [Akanthomyces muscarius]|uniref:Helicase-associated domain-containing protein n=1 Tax=Akanthomyces muscarius TaxID=2231603 RepID=A0A9W8UPN4_AKAMU|nr:hypothetical protein LMH87_001249 [Akanthomyces muscarius]KAJ4156035.1 hypothetical protein LMH87_001249 [Akanthomyces muscarius]